MFPHFPKLQTCGITKTHITQLWIHKSFWNNPNVFVDPQKSIPRFLWIHKNPKSEIVNPQITVYLLKFSHINRGDCCAFFLTFQNRTVKIAHFWFSDDFQTQKTSTCPYVFKKSMPRKYWFVMNCYAFLLVHCTPKLVKSKKAKTYFMPETRNDHQGFEGDVDNVACNSCAQKKYITTLHL